ncbi:MAG: hypothetical protein RL596_1527 [Bacteroidota bacterium]|jgi:hypothetical protein
MKYIISMMTLLLVGSLSLTAQQKNTTTAAEKAFAIKFPKATVVKWIKEKKNEYEVEFTLNGKKGSANFSGTGEWLETEMGILANELPTIVVDGFTKQFQGATITEAFLVESSTGKKYYEIEYTIKSKKREVKIDGTGNLID